MDTIPITKSVCKPVDSSNNMNNTITQKDFRQCAICYENMDLRNKNIVTLSCNHTYHYDCIFMTFSSNIKLNSRHYRACPFCRKQSDYLPLPKNHFPIKHIHKEYNTIKELLYQNDFKKLNNIAKSNNYFNQTHCQSIIMSGKNKGKQCKKKKKNGEEYCCIHIKNYS